MFQQAFSQSREQAARIAQVVGDLSVDGFKHACEESDRQMRAAMSYMESGQQAAVRGWEQMMATSKALFQLNSDLLTNGLAAANAATQPKSAGN